MIPLQDRFWLAGEAVTGTLHTGNIIDWDQRRWYTVNSSTKLCPPEKEVEIAMLKRHMDQLAEGVYSIALDDNGLLVSVSSAPEDDATLVPHYPRYSNVLSLHGCSIIERSKLTELDRFGPGVDLVSCVDSQGVQKRCVFKYTMIYQRMKLTWNELHILKSLTDHPHLVPLDRLVVDDTDSRLLGFTTVYVPGGTLQDNRDRVFRLEWLQQLTAVVDFLNLELKITHQDIAPRNLLVDPATDNLRLFDFDRASRIGGPGYSTERNDVTGVIFTVYEIITHDEHFRSLSFGEQNVEAVLSLEQWPVKGKLDCEVLLFRKHLDDWVRYRRQPEIATPVAARPSNDSFNIPDMPPPSPSLIDHNEKGEPVYESSTVIVRAEAVALKQPHIRWERPVHEKAYPPPSKMRSLSP